MWEESVWGEREREVGGGGGIKGNVGVKGAGEEVEGKKRGNVERGGEGKGKGGAGGGGGEVGIWGGGGWWGVTHFWGAPLSYTGGRIFGWTGSRWC